MPKVKCADCGFLAVRRESDWSLAEAPLDFRENGEVKIRTWQQNFHSYPVCFARAVQFHEEHPNPNSGRDYRSINGPELVGPILNRERSCESFVEWIQGFSPREHQEMLNQEKQIAWEREREEIVNQRETERDERARQWRKEDRVWNLIVFAVGTAVGIVSVLVSQ